MRITDEKSLTPHDARPKSHPRPRSRWFRLLGGQEGSNLVETAMAFLVLMPILFGAFEFSMAFYTYQDITDAARQASRWASVRGSSSCTNTPTLAECDATPDQIRAYVRGLGYPGVVSSNISVAPSWLAANSNTPPSPPMSWTSCGESVCNEPLNEVQVQVSYNFPISVPFWQVTTINLSSTSTAVIAQ